MSNDEEIINRADDDNTASVNYISHRDSSSGENESDSKDANNGVQDEEDELVSECSSSLFSTS